MPNSTRSDEDLFITYFAAILNNPGCVATNVYENHLKAAEAVQAHRLIFPLPVMVTVEERIDEIVQRFPNKKIDAIKEVRHVLNYDLATAKNLVEASIERLSARGLYPR